MIFSKMTKRIKEAFMVSGYSKTVKELQNLSNKQLADIGISRELLNLGVKGYPWRDEVASQEIPKNVTAIKLKQTVANTPTMPHTTKAA